MSLCPWPPVHLHRPCRILPDRNRCQAVRTLALVRRLWDRIVCAANSGMFSYADVFKRFASLAADQLWIFHAWLRIEDLLDLNPMFPAISEIVYVIEAVQVSLDQVGEIKLSSVVHRHDIVLIGVAEVKSSDHELVFVRACLGHDVLDREMKLSQLDLEGDIHASPDRGLYALERDFDSGDLVGHRLDPSSKLG